MVSIGGSRVYGQSAGQRPVFSRRLAAFANGSELWAEADSKTQKTPALVRRKAVGCNTVLARRRASRVLDAVVATAACVPLAPRRASQQPGYLLPPSRSLAQCRQAAARTVLGEQLVQQHLEAETHRN